MKSGKDESLWMDDAEIDEAIESVEKSAEQDFVASEEEKEVDEEQEKPKATAKPKQQRKKKQVVEDSDQEEEGDKPTEEANEEESVVKPKKKQGARPSGLKAPRKKKETAATKPAKEPKEIKKRKRKGILADVSDVEMDAPVEETQDKPVSAEISPKKPIEETKKSKPAPKKRKISKDNAAPVMPSLLEKTADPVEETEPAAETSSSQPNAKPTSLLSRMGIFKSASSTLQKAKRQMLAMRKPMGLDQISDLLDQ